MTFCMKKWELFVVICIVRWSIFDLLLFPSLPFPVLSKWQQRWFPTWVDLSRGGGGIPIHRGIPPGRLVPWILPPWQPNKPLLCPSIPEKKVVDFLVHFGAKLDQLSPEIWCDLIRTSFDNSLEIEMKRSIWRGISCKLSNWALLWLIILLNTTWQDNFLVQYSDTNL